MMCDLLADELVRHAVNCSHVKSDISRLHHGRVYFGSELLPFFPLPVGIAVCYIVMLCFRIHIHRHQNLKSHLGQNCCQCDDKGLEIAVQLLHFVRTYMIIWNPSFPCFILYSIYSLPIVATRANEITYTKDLCQQQFVMQHTHIKAQSYLFCIIKHSQTL